MFEATSTRFIRYLLIVLLFAFVAGTVAARLIDPARHARRAMLERHEARMEALNARLARENRGMASQLDAIEHGLAGWERVARRDQLMIRPGEVVFHFPKDGVADR